MNNILISIQDRLKSFSKTELKLANYILDRPEKVINMSIKELSEEAGVSSASIVRFCKYIGVDGYSNLKIQLSYNISSIKDKSYSEIEKGEDADLIINKLELRLNHAINGTKKLINHKTLKEIINLLYNAKQIQVFGIGASSLVASDIYQKFIRLGLSIIYNTDYHLAVTSLSVSKPDTIFIGISHSGKTNEIIKLLNIAKNRGLKSIAITSEESSQVGQTADYIILTEKTGESTIRTAATISLITQLFIVDIIFFNYLSKYYDETVDNIKISKQMLNEIKNLT